MVVNIAFFRLPTISQPNFGLENMILESYNDIAMFELSMIDDRPLSVCHAFLKFILISSQSASD